MKKQHSFSGYLLIGIGAFFLLRQLKLPFFTDFYSWPTLLIIIGIVFLIYGYQFKEYNQLFTGIIILGLGIHFHGLRHYSFWVDHWAVYPLLVGMALIIRALKLGKGMLLGLALVAASLFLIFSSKLPDWFNWIYDLVALFENYWPIVLIILGGYLLVKKN